MLATGHARADHTSVHVTASGDVALTDNLFSVPQSSNPESDVYTDIRPGVVGTWETPRMMQALAAEVEVLEYATHNNTDPSLTLRGRWDALFLLTPRSELGLGADASNGRINALTARSTADQTAIVVTPGGNSEVRQANASQRLSWQSTKATRTNESAFVHWGATSDLQAMPTTTNSLDVGASFGFERLFAHDDFGLEVGGDFLRLEFIAPTGTTGTMASRLDQQLNPHATASWRHDFSKKWSTALSGGVVYINPIGTDPYNPTRAASHAQATGVFSATAAYTGDWGGAQLAVARGVSPNLLIAQNTVNDSATLRLALPLPWLELSSRSSPHYTAVGSFGVARTQLVDPITSALEGSFQLVHVDLALQYRPRPSMTYSLRYEFAYQHGDTVAATVEPSFFRNTVYFEFAFRYPDRLAVQVPRRTGSVRADEGDLAPVGSEPVVPDAAAPAPAE
jgi:hypothetical protein